MSDGDKQVKVEENTENIVKMSPDKEYKEISAYVVFWGLFYAVIFALAVSYLCLKIGQTIDAFAPVSVLAMGMAMVLKRKNSFAENVHIQAIASAGTNMLGGATFILPAFFILNIQMSYFVMSVPIVLGSVLGLCLSIVFRKYFCEDMDAEYPFPSGRAAAKVLTSGSGDNAKLMVISGSVALIYDFIVGTFGWWADVFSTKLFGWGSMLVKEYKLVFKLEVEAALLGIGYMTGLRYAAIICAGSFFSWFVCIPVLYYMAGEHTLTVGSSVKMLKDMSLEEVFKNYVRHIGIGMLAMAGVLGLLSMFGVVKGVFVSAVKELFSSHDTGKTKLKRTQLDVPMKYVVLAIFIVAILFAVFFHFTYSESLLQTMLALLIVLVFAIFLSVVGISSIAFTGSEPVSGMTIFMLIVASIVMNSAGLSGELGTIAVLLMAACLCTSLGMAGNFMSEQKVGYLLGATPKKMQIWQFVSGLMVASILVAVVLVLDKAYGYVGDGALPAPQANAMAAIIKPMMEGGSAHWPLYISGAFFAVCLKMMNVPVLAFALGAYLPMEINTPLLIGGLIAHYVSSGSVNEALNRLRHEKGTVIASGFIAGGALGGLFSAVLRIMNINVYMSEWAEGLGAAYLALFVYLAMCALLYFKATAVKESDIPKEDDED